MRRALKDLGLGALVLCTIIGVLLVLGVLGTCATGPSITFPEETPRF